MKRLILPDEIKNYAFREEYQDMKAYFYLSEKLMERAYTIPLPAALIFYELDNGDIVSEAACCETHKFKFDESTKWEEMKKLVEENKNEVFFFYRHMPPEDNEVRYVKRTLIHQ